MDWLSEIDEEKLIFPYLRDGKGVNVARVLREFGEFMVGYVDEYWWEEGELSEDVMELCVAAKESSRDGVDAE